MYLPYLLSSHIPTAQPRRHRARLPPRVRQLDHDLAPLAVHELDDLLHRLHLRVLPQPDVFRGDAAFGLHGRGFDADEARAALRDAAEVREVPHRHVAVFGGVLAQGGELGSVS